MEKTTEDEARELDAPSGEEHFWRLAIGSSTALAIAIFVWALVYIFDVFHLAAEDGEAVDRARIATPILATIGAVVTFCTVMWRGTITKRQVDSDAEKGLAELLEKGVERLDATDLKKTSLGIAMLETVAIAPNDKYAAYALEKIAYAVADVVRESQSALTRRIMSQADAIFDRAAEMKRLDGVQVEIGFNPNHPDDPEPEQVTTLRLRKSTPRGTYINCAFSVTPHACALAAGEDEAFHFQGCDFRLAYASSEAGRIVLHRIAAGNGNSYTGFRFSRVEPAYHGNRMNTYFEVCDFTDAEIHTFGRLKGFRFSRCGYHEGHPPKLFIQGEEVDFLAAAKDAGYQFEEYGIPF